MTHPTNPTALKVKRDGPRGWHWVGAFDPAIHELYEDLPVELDGTGKELPPVSDVEREAPPFAPEAQGEAPAVEPVVKPKAKRPAKRKGR